GGVVTIKKYNIMAGRNANIYFPEETYNKLRQVAGPKISRFVSEAPLPKIKKSKKKWKAGTKPLVICERKKKNNEISNGQQRTSQRRRYLNTVRSFIENSPETGLDEPSKILGNYPHTIYKKLRLVGKERLGVVSPEIMEKDLQNRGVIANSANLEKFYQLKPEEKIIYLGIDCTAETLHIGHLFLLIQTIRFANQGFQVLLVLGGATSKIGDPSDKLKERPQLEAKKLSQYYQEIKQQLARIVIRPATSETINKDLAKVIILEQRWSSIAKNVLSNDAQSNYEKAGAVKAFEVCFELVHPILRRVLKLRGIIVSSAIKEVFRVAGSENLINNVETWLEFKDKRDDTAHSYDGQIATDVIDILPNFIYELDLLMEELLEIPEIQV
ncbi:11178_t:CDS:2, partial [Ambispora gerdemannii]